MQASTVILTNESGTSTVQILFVAHVKLEPTDDSVFMLLDSEDDICASIDLLDTSAFPCRSVNSTPSLLPMHIAKSPCSPMYGRLVHYNTPFQRPPLHPSPSSIRLTIVDALKLTKSRKKSKSYLASIDFDNIDVYDMKYLPSFFNGNVFFLLSPMPHRFPSMYGCSMDSMDKMCDSRLWCTAKTTNIQNDFELFFQRPICASYLQCHNVCCDYMHRNGGCAEQH